ncbi:MAG: CHAD domain-containing protein, partial [Shewanella sp.]
IVRLSDLRDAQVYAARFGNGRADTLLRVRVPLFSARLDRWLQALEQCADTCELPNSYRRHLAHRLDTVLAHLDEAHIGSLSHRQLLRRWHHLRLEIKQARYGAELLLMLGAGTPEWIGLLGDWQERLGQLQDWYQWRRALKGSEGACRIRHKLKGKIRVRMHRLNLQQAELVGLKLAMKSCTLRSP